MYVQGGWTPPRPERPRPRLTAGQQRAVIVVLAVNVVLMLIAPIGGATLVHAIMAALAR